jgi:uncharacterized protein
LGLDDLAELPAAPCLSSRIETGLPIRSDLLPLIDVAEQLVRGRLVPETVRCRIRGSGVVVELDEAALARLGPAAHHDLAGELAALFAGHGVGAVSFAPYRRGSAFLRGPLDG